MPESSQSRLQTPLPRLGIRPIVDGRYGGVRESLESVALAMAKSAQKLVASRVRHSCGLSVECVIPDFAIGGLAESARCDAIFARENVGATLSVTPCWCYGSETMDAHPHRPKAIWGFNGTDRPGAVYLAAALAGHNQIGLPCFSIYGKDVQDLGDERIPNDVADKIVRFVKSAMAVSTMRSTNYLSIGGTSMGIAGSSVDRSFFRRFLGMGVMAVDMSEVLGRIQRGIFDADDFARAMRWIESRCKEGKDPNPAANRRTKEQKRGDWETSAKMALIFRDLMVGNERLREMGFPEQARGSNALIGGFQGQRQWTDHFTNGDFPEAVLNSSFDWNGIRQPYVFATENDSLNAVSMLMGHLLTGTAQLFSDVRTYWSPESVQRVAGERPTGVAENGFLHLINSGPSALDWTGRQTENGIQTVKPWWGVNESDVRACMDHTLWCESDLGYFPGGGWSTDFTTAGGLPMTLCRINLNEGLGPTLQIAEGWSAELPEAIHNALDRRTSPSWPTTWFVPRLTESVGFSSVYDVMLHWGANHGAGCIGHIGSDLITLASMLRIPVDLSNVADAPKFRPSSWHRFGSGLDEVGADFRACAAYGPLYA